MEKKNKSHTRTHTRTYTHTRTHTHTHTHTHTYTRSQKYPWRPYAETAISGDWHRRAYITFTHCPFRLFFMNRPEASCRGLANLSTRQTPF